jgi:hypothetical protein
MIIKSKIPIGGDCTAIHIKNEKGVAYQTLICAPQQAIKVPDGFKYNPDLFEELEKTPRRRYNVEVKEDGRTVRGDFKEMVNVNVKSITD